MSVRARTTGTLVGSSWMPGSSRCRDSTGTARARSSTVARRRPAAGRPRGPAGPRTSIRGRRSGAGRATDPAPVGHRCPARQDPRQDVSEPSTATRRPPGSCRRHAGEHVMRRSGQPGQHDHYGQPGDHDGAPRGPGRDARRFSRARAAASTGPAQVEAVVDPDRHPDQQRDRGGGAVDRQPAARMASREIAEITAVPASSSGAGLRSARRTRSAGQRDRDRGDLGLAEVLAGDAAGGRGPGWRRPPPRR